MTVFNRIKQILWDDRKAPLSEEILKVLQDDQKANELVDAILRNRASGESEAVTVTINGKTKVYKPVTSIRR